MVGSITLLSFLERFGCTLTVHFNDGLLEQKQVYVWMDQMYWLAQIFNNFKSNTNVLCKFSLIWVSIV